MQEEKSASAQMQSPAPEAPAKWFARGCAAGILIMASLNAVSYFLRSSAWNTLIGTRSDPNESIGFPWEMWEGGNSYAGMYVDYPVLGLNALSGLLVGVVVGGLFASQAARLNRMLGREHFAQQRSAEPSDEHRRIQFSLRGLMVATSIIAVASDAGDAVRGSPRNSCLNLCTWTRSVGCPCDVATETPLADACLADHSSNTWTNCSGRWRWREPENRI